MQTGRRVPLTQMSHSQLVKLARRYYAEERHPQRAGVSVSYQNRVIGEIKGSQKYFEVNVSAMADGQHGMYLSQQVSSWASVLFPAPWRDFVKWHSDVSRRDGASPCLPGV